MVVAMERLKDINWNQLYYFYEVARKLSIKETANNLDLSSATISEQIKKLEEKFNLKLFDRSQRTLSLTTDGEKLFEFSKEIFEIGMRLLDNISNHEVGGYAVKIGVQENLSELKELQFISQYYDLYAPFGIVNTIREYHYETLLSNLLDGNVDWILTNQKPIVKGVEYAKVADYEIEFCISKQLLENFEDKKEIFSTVPIALSTRNEIVTNQILNTLGETGIFPEEVIESDHGEFCMMLVERGRCILPTDKSIMKETGWIKDTAFFTIDEPIKIPVYAAWKKNNGKMLAIQKLRQLIELSDKPLDYDNPELLVQIAQVNNN
jgi:LysR family transcriptional activator of nhaA